MVNINRGKDYRKVKINRIKQINKLKKKSINIFRVNGELRIIPLIINILIPVLGGLIVGFINKNTMEIYESLKKPIINPPSNLFPIIWTILYILMGIAAYRIYMLNKQGIDDKGAYFFYIVQLLFNLMWPFIFFTFRLYGISFIWLCVLFILVIITFIKFIKVDKIAGFLLIPYILWLVFAGILNFFIWLLNEM